MIRGRAGPPLRGLSPLWSSLSGFHGVDESDTCFSTRGGEFQGVPGELLAIWPLPAAIYLRLIADGVGGAGHLAG